MMFTPVVWVEVRTRLINNLDPGPKHGTAQVSGIHRLTHSHGTRERVEPQKWVAPGSSVGLTPFSTQWAPSCEMRHIKLT